MRLTQTSAGFLNMEELIWEGHDLRILLLTYFRQEVQ